MIRLHGLEQGCHEMTVPILKQGEYLLSSVPSRLGERELAELRDALAAHLKKYHSKAIILDVSGLDVIDAFGTRSIRELIQSARLRGARTVLVGIQAEVALAVVQLGLDLGNPDTALDFEEAVEILQRDSTRSDGINE